MINTLNVSAQNRLSDVGSLRAKKAGYACTLCFARIPADGKTAIAHKMRSHMGFKHKPWWNLTSGQSRL